MQKEEFPTFLNEQPTIIFGRTGRELLIIVCGIVTGYTTWGSVTHSLPGVGGQVLGYFLAALLVIASLVLSLTTIGSRPLEEWFVVWLVYVMMPRVYLYQPLQEETDDLISEKNDSQSANDADLLEED